MVRRWIRAMAYAVVLMWIGSPPPVASASHAIPRRIHPPMKNPAREKVSTWKALNAIRAGLGMPKLRRNSALEKAAQAHADYLIRHRITSHFESASRAGFTGRTPMDRALRAGYPSRLVGENLSTHNTDGADSLRGLFAAIYHRFGFLNPAYDEVGIGVAQSKKDPRNSAFVYLMGMRDVAHLCTEPAYKGVGRYVYGVCADSRHRIAAQAYDRARNRTKERSPERIVYPYDGQTEVPPVFYQERPDPLPEYDVSGYPISVAFNDRYVRKVTLVSFALYEADGAHPIPSRLLDKRSDPNHKLTRRQFALLPLKRLKYGTTYRVKLVYRHGKKIHTHTWSFTTIRPKKRLKIIRTKTAKLRLRAGEGYWLYFAPLTRHDVLGTMVFPGKLPIGFVDRNTMYVVIGHEQKRGFTIKGSGRRVQIEIVR